MFHDIIASIVFCIYLSIFRFTMFSTPSLHNTNVLCAFFSYLVPKCTEPSILSRILKLQTLVFTRSMSSLHIPKVSYLKFYDEKFWALSLNTQTIMVNIEKFVNNTGLDSITNLLSFAWFYQA